MWTLWIFGDNVEDRMGRLRYLAFYLLSGLAAGLVHWLTNLDSTVPTIGASGAIAGVMGGYLLLFPKARVDILIFIIFIIRIITIPAWIMLGLWFAFQLFGGAGQGFLISGYQDEIRAGLGQGAADLGGDGDGIGDACDDIGEDCNGNNIDDACDLAWCPGDPACADCDGNGRLDECDVADGHDFVAAAAERGVLGAVEAGGSRTVAGKPLRGAAVLRDLLREHFRKPVNPLLD